MKDLNKQSVGDLTAHIAPTSNKQLFGNRTRIAVPSALHIFMEYDFSFKKKIQSIDYFLIGIREGMRIREYYMQEVFVSQEVTDVLPFKPQHLPSNNQHSPFKPQHSPVKQPTPTVENPTLAVNIPTSNVWIGGFPLKYQHFADKTPTLTHYYQKVLAI